MSIDTGRVANTRRRKSLRVGPLRALALVTGVALLMSACGAEGDQRPMWGEPNGGSGPGQSSGPASGEGLEEKFAELYSQNVTWEQCGAFECATVQAPIDWNDASSDTVEIAISRSKATSGNAIGSLLVNPGGPGGSGIEFLRSAVSMGMFSEKLQASYDIVGFDPRGVGDSSPVVCLTGEALETFLYSYDDPATDAGQQATIQNLQNYAQACADNTGELLGYVDTVSAAKDMDLLRAVLGDESLHYLGFSYGTALGATYAQIFPNNVGRMVLDGAVDLSLPSEESGVAQMEGFENALRAYVAHCLSQTNCPLDGSVDDAIGQIQDLIQETRTSPLGSMDGREVNATVMIYGLVTPLYSEDNWVLLTLALDAAFNMNNGDIFLVLADAYFGRTGPGKFDSNSSEAFRAVNCLDGSQESLSEAEEAELTQRYKEASPTLGWYFGEGVDLCKYWPYEPTGGPFTPTAEGAAPIVVVGTTGDPATPYAQSEAMAEQLSSGVLLTYEGEGHTAYGSSNDCITDAVDAYLVDGVAPVAGTTC